MEGFSPFHSRVMVLYDCLEDNFHRARFDNLYMVTRFGLNSFRYKKQMLVKGVCRTGAGGIPSGVLQRLR